MTGPADPTDRTRTIAYTPTAGQERSVAVLLDGVRGLLAEATGRGEQPERLVLAPELYDLVLAAKEREVRRGAVPTLFGLRLDRGGSD